MRKKRNYPLLIIGLSIIGIILRFYNLNWGFPYPFHPDERNMADAITRMRFPDLNPHFFAYGQFPLFLAYFTGIFINWLNKIVISFPNYSITQLLNYSSVSFPQAILLLRFFSALSQVLLLLVLYKIAKLLFPKNPLITNYLLLITIFLPGLIQSAHFGTTESLLTLFLFLTVYFSLKIADNTAKWFEYLFLILTLGFSLGTKLTALLYFSIPIFSLIVAFLFKKKNNKIKRFYFWGKNFLELLKATLLSIFIIFSSLIVSFLVSPYNIWEYPDFLGALRYESDVAMGRILVFYTRQFLNTSPFIFQFTKIFPYALGWPIFILSSLGLILILINLARNLFKKSNQLITNYLLIITFSFLIYFIPNAILFTKWTRFMAPIFPFFTIFSAYFLSVILNLFQNLLRSTKSSLYRSWIKPGITRIKKLPPYILHTTYYIFLFLLIYPGLLFFYQVYCHEDIRLTASRWIYQNIPSGSHVLSETGNVIDIPVSPLNYSITNYSITSVSFDFYHLDENPELLNQLITELEKADYIFIPSRRIFANHLRLPEKYPLTAKYYNLLFSQKLGFVKIKEFSRLNDEFAEETWSVFDHPRIRIYKKIVSLTKEDYEKIFWQRIH